MSKDTAIRFIAVYPLGGKHPFTHLVLGHGYEESGRDHWTLADLYKTKGLLCTQLSSLYAGYLSVEDNKVKVFRGGSGRLGISWDENQDAKLLESFAQLEATEEVVVRLFPMIISGEIEHVMLARQKS